MSLQLLQGDPCLSICFRCKPEGWSSDASAVLDAFALYAARDDGFMERFERPNALQAGILGRVPPLIAGARQVERRPAPAEPT